MRKIYFVGLFLSSIATQAQLPTVIGDTGTVAGNDGITYSIVKAKDAMIWTRQDLGATAVDQVGDLYQWGRYNDGHQVRIPSNVANATASPNDPTVSMGSSGEPFYAYNWWGSGNPTDTWDATTPATQTGSNGCDPCVNILGPNWTVPTQTEWNNLLFAESITSTSAAQTSNTRLALGGYRNDGYNGSISFEGSAGYYWTKTAYNSPGQGAAYMAMVNNAPNVVNGARRGQGNSMRCIYHKSGVGISESVQQKGISVFPSITNDAVIIKSTTADVQKVVVVSLTGAIVTEVAGNNSTELSVSLSQQPAGIYFIQVQKVNAVITEKIIKQ